MIWMKKKRGILNEEAIKRREVKKIIIKTYLF